MTSEYNRQWRLRDGNGHRRNARARELYREKLAQFAAIPEPSVACKTCGNDFLRTPARRASGSYECTPCRNKRQAGKRLTSGRRYLEKYPEKTAARKLLHEALRKGVIVRRPCERCGSQRTHAHHDDYSKPLQVRWLCHLCHEAVHHKSVEQFLEMVS